VTRTGRGLIGWSVMAVALLWLPTVGVIGAQDTAKGPPPFPLLFEGSAILDGEAVASGELTVRIGDWESRPVAVADGRFVCSDPCLIAGPPNEDYIGLAVTFLLDGTREATLTFPFEPGPARVGVELVFGVTTPTPVAPSGGLPTPGLSRTPTAPPVPVPGTGPGSLLLWTAGIAAVVAAIGAGAGGVVRRRRRRP
jgi:hypothetical protein